MKIVCLNLFSVAILFLIAGCGHNVITYGDGIQTEVGFIPEQYKISLTFRYGKILSACVRENTEVEMEGEGAGKAGDDNGQKSADAGSKGKLKIKIGKQITGYYVDAIKAGASQKELDQYLKDDKKYHPCFLRVQGAHGISLGAFYCSYYVPGWRCNQQRK